MLGVCFSHTPCYCRELKSYHIVEAYGVMFGPDTTYLVMEYMNKRDLLKYLKHRETKLRIEVGALQS